MSHPGDADIPDRDAMLAMSVGDFVGLWQRVVGETPAVLLARADMVRLLAEVHEERHRVPLRGAARGETAAA